MLRHRLRADKGYTLVELLVVILIIGILAAVALSSLVGQRTKAQDAGAKTAVVTTAKAMTAYGTDNATFDGVTKADLVNIDRSIEEARNLQITADTHTFTVAVESAAGTVFSIERSATGAVKRDCTQPGTGACRETADVRGNRW